MFAGWWKRKIWRPLKSLFTQGASPEKIAQCLLIGAAISLSPLLGLTSILCGLAAVRMKLNMAAIQAVNWLFAGVQLAMIPIFIRLGEWIFRGPKLPFSVEELVALAQQSPFRFVRDFSSTALRAVGAWAILVLPVALALYPVLVRALRAALVRWRRRAAEPAYG